MGCDMCGRDGQLYKVRVESTVMTVCEHCKGYGQLIERVPTPRDAKSERKLEKDRSLRGEQLASKEETMLLVRDDYGAVIKAAREKTGLLQEEMAKRLNLKESQYHAYESGQRRPDLETARKLEKSLKIALVREHVEKHEGARARMNGPVTIGDLITIKKRGKK